MVGLMGEIGAGQLRTDPQAPEIIAAAVRLGSWKVLRDIEAKAQRGSAHGSLGVADAFAVPLDRLGAAAVLAGPADAAVDATQGNGKLLPRIEGYLGADTPTHLPPQRAGEVLPESFWNGAANQAAPRRNPGVNTQSWPPANNQFQQARQPQFNPLPNQFQR